jgi:hypothetical protein
MKEKSSVQLSLSHYQTHNTPCMDTYSCIGGGWKETFCEFKTVLGRSLKSRDCFFTGTDTIRDWSPS